jgi:hypothetical protein
LSLTDGQAPPAPSKVFFYLKIVAAIACLALIAGFFANIVAPGPLHLFWYRAEKNRVRNFMNAVTSGNTEQAYRLWGPSQSYSYKDFLEDWGVKGYYGPARSYTFKDAEHPKNGSGVIVTVDVSPYAKFPAGDEEAEAETTKEVRIWVQYDSNALSFAP